MEISYKSRIYDSIYFNIYTNLREPIFLIIISLLALHYSYYSIKGMTGGQYSWYVHVFAFLYFMLLFGIISLVWILLIAVIMSVLRKNKSVLTDHRIIINEEGLIEETKYNKSEHKWNGLHKLKETKKYIIIYITHWSGHVIPKSCFVDENQGKEFYNYCVQKLSENKEK